MAHKFQENNVITQEPLNWLDHTPGQMTTEHISFSTFLPFLTFVISEMVRVVKFFSRRHLSHPCEACVIRMCEDTLTLVHSMKGVGTIKKLPANSKSLRWISHVDSGKDSCRPAVEETRNIRKKLNTDIRPLRRPIWIQM